MAVLITGGTGFVGRHLLPKFDKPWITSRNRANALSKLGNLVGGAVQWSPESEPLNVPTDAPIDAVVNLMGDSIAEGRWTESKKKRIRDSRVAGTEKLIAGLLERKTKPAVLVSASAVGFYGDAGEDIITEDGPMGTGFLPDVSDQWERAADEAEKHGIRVVKLRIGIVLGADGGALEKMVPLFKLGLGGKLGSGQQWFPWIHVDDLASMIHWAIETPTARGVYNATAPNPVRNAEFTKSLAAAVNRWAILPAPKIGLRLALGEFANSLFFSQRVVPEKLIAQGFQFQYPDLPSALDQSVKFQSVKPSSA